MPVWWWILLGVTYTGGVIVYWPEMHEILREMRGMMPVRKVKGGYKYGPTGKVYRGKGAKAKAAKQGRAISISKARAKGHSIPKKKK